MFSWIQTSAVWWDHKRKLLSRIHVASVSDLHLPPNTPVSQMQSWGIAKLKASLSPPSPCENQVWLEVSEMLHLLSSFSALREKPAENRKSLLSLFKRSWKAEERMRVLEGFECWSEERVLVFTDTAYININITQGSGRARFIAFGLSWPLSFRLMGSRGMASLNKVTLLCCKEMEVHPPKE